MDLQQVRYFLALCQEKSFTRAARRCGVAQPSLTNGIKKLETKLGARLFRRHRRGAELSDAGRAVLPSLMSIEWSAEEARRAIENLNKVTRSISRRSRRTVTGVASYASRPS